MPRPDKSSDAKHNKPQRPHADEVRELPPDALEKLSSCLVDAQAGNEAIKRHLGVVVDLAQARAAFASLFDPSKNLLAVAELRGRANALVKAVAPGEGPVGRAFVSAELVRDEGHDVLCLPLLDGKTPRGVLTVVGAKRHVADAVWRALASHLSAAVQVAAVRDSLTRRTRDLETAVAGLRSLDRARDELLGNVSHELKNPLTTIKAYLAMFRREQLGPLTDKQKRAFEVCERNGDRLLRLINDMLLMSRLQSARMRLTSKPFGLRALVDDAVRALAPVANGAGVEVTVVRSGEVYVKGDRERMLEAVTNLLENAIVFNRRGGSVEIALTGASGVANLTVKDTGVGIAADELPNIFDRFFRGQGLGARRGGAGLGLPISRQIVHLHGGSISAESAEGVGTTVKLQLPLFAGAVNLDLPEETPAPLGHGILLVEDDDDCREVLAEILETEGLHVACARDAEKAIHALATSTPAVVLLDLRLGGGDGRTVLKSLRDDPRLKDTPVFVISGEAESAAGFTYDGPERIDGFFEKPLNLPRLVGRILEIVRPAAQANG